MTKYRHKYDDKAVFLLFGPLGMIAQSNSNFKVVFYLNEKSPIDTNGSTCRDDRPVPDCILCD